MPEAVIMNDWNKLIVPQIEADDLVLSERFLHETLNAYSGEDRYYHNLIHIVDCMQKLEPYQDREDYAQLWLALLWHDEVYKSNPNERPLGSMSNEKESARLAYTRMERLSIPGAYKVGRLIVATQLHNSDREDEQLVNDIDMSILAEPMVVYDAYARGIEKEFAWMGAERYRAGRIHVLEHFARPIFSHPDFAHLNKQADKNIEDEITWLKAA